MKSTLRNNGKECVRLAARTVATVGSGFGSRQTIALAVPDGLPTGVAKQVAVAIERLLKAVSPNSLNSARSAAPPANYVTWNNCGYLLHTANGKTVFLADNRQTRLLLMLLANPRRRLSLQEMILAGESGHRHLYQPSNDQALENDLHEASPDMGESIDGKARKQVLAALKVVREKKAQAELDGDAEQAAAHAADEKALVSYLRAHTTVSGRIRHQSTPQDAKAVHAIGMAISRAIKGVRDVDRVMGDYIDNFTDRAGSFIYSGDPALDFDVCPRHSPTIPEGVCARAKAA